MAGAVVLAGGLSGCGAAAEGGGDGSDLAVAASFYPLAYVAERVGGDAVAVTSLTSPGQEPHDLELSVEATATIADADLVLYLDRFQPAVDEAVAQEAPDTSLDAARAVGLERGDLHFWLDPAKMAALGRAVQERLAEADPSRADAFAENQAALEADLTDLERDYTEGLADCEVTTLVTSHDAFGYLERFGLEVAPVAGLSPDAEPSPAQLAELQQRIRQDQVTTVFSETLASPELAETLAFDLGLDTAVLDPIEGLSDDTADEDYLSLMRRNLDVLRAANGCR